MITCPWCGTHYLEFQPNCRNCGGILPEVSHEDPFQVEAPPAPPPAPRPVSNRYAWRLLSADGAAVASGIITLMGLIFFPLGLALTLAVVTAFVGVPFLLLGLAFLGAGLVFFVLRYQAASRRVTALQTGLAVQGRIISVEQNLSVRVNGRSPWVIAYAFQAAGQECEGKVSTLNTPTVRLQAGNPAWVLYLPDQPAVNALYPHP